MNTNPQNITNIQELSDAPTVIVIFLLIAITYIMALFEAN